MAQRRVAVGSPVGLHARPAAVFAKAAGAAGLPVLIAKAGRTPVDASSILAVLGLDVQGGEEVLLSADGPGASEALDELVALLATGLRDAGE
jgi:phosphocarrier protein